jgi:hypothetical protein
MYFKAIVLLLFIFQSIAGFGQDKKLDFSIDYSIGQSFRRVKGDKDVLTYRDAERPTFTHGVNFQLQYKLSERVGLVSGLGYNQYGEEIENTVLYFGNSIDPRIGFVFSPSATTPTAVKFKYLYEFISIPILMDYAIVSKEKSAIDIQLGGTLNYLIGSRVITKIEYSDDKKDRSASRYNFESNDLNLAGQFGVNYKKNLGEKYFWKIGAQYNYFFTSISNSSLIDHYPNRTSIHLGIGF